MTTKKTSKKRVSPGRSRRPSKPRNDAGLIPDAWHNGRGLSIDALLDSVVTGSRSAVELQLLVLDAFRRSAQVLTKPGMIGGFNHELLCAFVQAIADSHLNGIFDLQTAAGFGNLVLGNGNVLAARWNDTVDLQSAAFSILSQEECTLVFRSFAGKPKARGIPVKPVLLEVMRKRDEKLHAEPTPLPSVQPGHNSRQIHGAGSPHSSPPQH